MLTLQLHGLAPGHGSAIVGRSAGIAAIPCRLQRPVIALVLAGFVRPAKFRILNFLSGGSEQLVELNGRFSVTDLGQQLDETSGAFMDTAAVLKNLDLVVTVDTALAHLAGALGVPVWMAQAFAPDWRWQWDRETTPWYPTMRFFRQARWGEWPAVFARIAEPLRALSADSRPERPQV